MVNQFSPLDGLLSRPRPSLIPFLYIFLRTLLLFSALPQSPTLLFTDTSPLLPKNTRVGDTVCHPSLCLQLGARRAQPPSRSLVSAVTARHPNWEQYAAWEEQNHETRNRK